MECVVVVFSLEKSAGQFFKTHILLFTKLYSQCVLTENPQNVMKMEGL